MDFVVTLKGYCCYVGSFTDVCDYIRRCWGSPELAADNGVRVMPAHRYQAG